MGSEHIIFASHDNSLRASHRQVWATITMPLSMVMRLNPAKGGFLSLGSRLGLIPFLVLALLLIAPTLTTSGVGLEVTTSFPDILLDGDVRINGTANGTYMRWEETRNISFHKGTWSNVHVSPETVFLRPWLEPELMNDGEHVFEGTGDEDDWDVYAKKADVIKVGDTYYMYYTGQSGWYVEWGTMQIGLATSKDGVNWTRYANNPIVKVPGGNSGVFHVHEPTVLYDEGTWRMYFAIKMDLRYQSDHVGYAESNDGYTWTYYSGNPIIKYGGSSWMTRGVLPVAIHKNESGGYWLYMRGDWGYSNSYPLALATSTDGINFTEYGYLYSPGNSPDWNKLLARYGTLEVVDGTYRLWIQGNQDSDSVGYVYSPDGLEWTVSKKPLIEPESNTNYSRGLFYPHVVDEGDHYLCWAGFVHSTWGGPHGIGLFKLTPVNHSGWFESRLFDAGGVVSVLGGGWSARVPSSGLLNLSVRWGNDTTSMTSWTRVGSLDELTGVTARYFQYRLDFWASNDIYEVEFERFALRFLSPLDRVEYSIDGGDWTPVDGLTNWSVDLALGDGDHRVEVRALDTVGNGPTEEVRVMVDLYPPTGSILIEEGRNAISSRYIEFSVKGEDSVGVKEVKVSLHPDLSGAQWKRYPYANNLIYYPGEDGEVTLYARFRDRAGRVSAIVNDSIIIDTHPPEANLTIDGDAVFTEQRQVHLDLDWSDLTGVAAMRVSNEPTFSGVEWDHPVRSLDWTLDGPDGVRWVHVMLMDALGQTTTLKDDIVLDMTPPGVSISIDENEEFTMDRDVNLAITISDANARWYKLANDEEDWPGSWTRYPGVVSKRWTLSSGPDGPRSVRIQVKDTAGHVVVGGDAIVLDTGPPEGEVIVGDGSGYATDTLLNITMDVVDLGSGMSTMRLSTTPLTDGDPWVPFDADFHWSISPVEGARTVFSQVKDRVGLVSSMEFPFVLDTEAPTGSFTIAGGERYVQNSIVQLWLSIDDTQGMGDIRLSNDPDLTDDPWMGLSDRVNWDLGTLEGTRTVYLEARDLAGNTIRRKASTVLDLTGPFGSLVINVGAEATTQGLVDVWWFAEDATGLVRYRLSSSPDMEGVEWTDWTEGPGGRPMNSWTQLTTTFLTQGEGLNEVYLELVDLAGRSTLVSDSIWYVAGTLDGSIVVDDGSGWTATSEVDVTFISTDDVQATYIRAASTLEELLEASWLPIEQGYPVTLEGTDGAKEVHVQVRGPHNLTMEPMMAIVVLDSTPPVLSFTQPVPGTVNAASQVFNLSVSDNLSPTPELEWRLDDGPWTPLNRTWFVTDLPEGRHTIEARATDEAGNSQTTSLVMEYKATTLDLGGSWPWLVIMALVVVDALAIALMMRRRRGSR